MEIKVLGPGCKNCKALESAVLKTLQADNLAARSFMLGDKVKQEFSKYDLKTGDEVLVAYVVNDKKQNVIVEIIKLGPKG